MIMINSTCSNNNDNNNTHKIVEAAHLGRPAVPRGREGRGHARGLRALCVYIHIYIYMYIHIAYIIASNIYIYIYIYTHMYNTII